MGLGFAVGEKAQREKKFLERVKNENRNEIDSKKKMSMAECVSGSFSLTFKPTTLSRRYHTPISNFSFFRSNYSLTFGYLTRSNSHVYHAVTSDSKATSLDLTQPDFDNNGGGGNGNGNGNGSGGGGGGSGGGGGDSNKGEEGSDGDKKKMAMLMSQKFTLAYAALVGGNSLSLSLARNRNLHDFLR